MANSLDRMNQITDRRAKRKKKQKRSWLVKGSIVLMVLYLVLSFVFSMYSGVSTTIAQKGTIEEEIIADGYVFRDQSVIAAPVSGYLECWVDEGQRVVENQTVGSIYTGQYDPERSQKILELRERIARLEAQKKEGIYSGNSVMTEQKIAAAARNLSDMRLEHNVSYIADSKDNIDLLIERKNSAETDQKVQSENVLTDLKRQLGQLETEIEGGRTELLAGSAGVFYSRIDGLEEKLSVNALNNISVSYLDELDKTPLEHNETIVQGQPVAKVVNNYGWYFAANMKTEEAEYLEVGKTVRLRFFDLSDTTVYGRVHSMSEEENGRVAVTIYTNRFVEGIYNASRTSAEVVLVSAEGIKVPAKSLHMEGQQTGLYVLRLGVARFVPVKVHYKNGDWAVVSSVTDIDAEYTLQIYDEVIVDAKNLEDGKVVR